MENKKAEMSMNVLITIIIILITGTFLLFFVARLADNTSNMADIQACRNSLILASDFREIQGKPLTNLDCKRSELIFRKKEIVEDGEINQELVGEMLVEAMGECWYMFGTGKLDPYSSIGTAGTTYCLTCKEIVFDDGLISYLDEKESSPDYDWTKHKLLKLPNYNLRMPNSEETYGEFFKHTPKIGISKDPNIIDENAVILEHGSLLGISSLKITSTQKCSGFPDSASQIGYMMWGNKEGDDTLFSTLFIAPPLHLRSYDWSGGVLIKDREGWLEMTANKADELIEKSLYYGTIGLSIDALKSAGECYLGLFDDLPDNLHLCQIMVN
ncbi:MAG: hypothetical protein KAQ83_04665 [Nanoarchaeota archaeon]|nr:hypothetical protein [Nanoarchaeota archaeon]